MIVIGNKEVKGKVKDMRIGEGGFGPPLSGGRDRREGRLKQGEKRERRENVKGSLE